MTAVMAVVGIALQRNASPKLLSVVLHSAPVILMLAMYSWPNSWRLYALLIEFFGLTSVALAILLWIQS
jgi:hypothetical protein